MNRRVELAVRLLNSQRGRYVVCGVFNVAVNYVIGAEIYERLLGRLNYLIVATIVSIVSISISFTTHKLFVFQTEDKWWIEYLRSYVVYGTAAVLNIGLMWILLNRLHTNVWLAQALVTAVAVVISYIGHIGFTFRRSKSRDANSAL